MRLAQRLKAGEPEVRANGPECSLSVLLRGLDQDDADALKALVYDRLDLPASVVERFLAEDEDDPIDLAQGVINRHRRDRCRWCSRR